MLRTVALIEQDDKKYVVFFCTLKQNHPIKVVLMFVVKHLTVYQVPADKPVFYKLYHTICISSITRLSIQLQLYVSSHLKINIKSRSKHGCTLLSGNYYANYQSIINISFQHHKDQEVCRLFEQYVFLILILYLQQHFATFCIILMLAINKRIYILNAN